MMLFTRFPEHQYFILHLCCYPQKRSRIAMVLKEIVRREVEASCVRTAWSKGPKSSQKKRSFLEFVWLLLLFQKHPKAVVLQIFVWDTFESMWWFQDILLDLLISPCPAKWMVLRCRDWCAAESEPWTGPSPQCLHVSEPWNSPT